MCEEEFVIILKEIVHKVILGTFNVKEIKQKIQNQLETNDIWECNNLLITDCYYALKHMQEELISMKEWIYFEQCFDGCREYSLEDKKRFILEN